MGRVSVAGFAPDETILSSQDGRERLGEQCLPITRPLAYENPGIVPEPFSPLRQLSRYDMNSASCVVEPENPKSTG